MSEKLHITAYSQSELADLVTGIGEPKYRAKQIFKGLHERRLRDFDEMTDLPKAFREKLERNCDRFDSEQSNRVMSPKTARGVF